jgi:DNA-binding NtrC family response regulator
MTLSHPPALIVVDDEDAVQYSFRRMMVREGFEVETFSNGTDALARIRKGGVSVVVLDVRLGGDMDGTETLRRIKEFDPKITVILMTAYASANTAIEATRHGAYDYVLKPFESGAMRELIHHAHQAHEAMATAVVFGDDEDSTEGDCIIGLSPAMQEVYKKIGRVALATEPVLICGESGTGKELVARALYQFSKRKDAIFLPINCGAIPENLLESEFFGHEKGSFTGAHERKIGKFEQANGGTVFLDEIGEMPLETQVKLLRFLEDKIVTRVGGASGRKVDVRILAATNRPLAEKVAEGKFRGDLYFRLNVVTIELPALRDRREDIPLLARYFLKKHARANGQEPPAIHPLAMQALIDHDWPGNARELENTIRRVLVHGRGHAISPEDLGLGEMKMIGAGDTLSPAGGQPLKAHLSGLLKKAQYDLATTGDCCPVLPEIEKVLVTEALELTRGNQVQASKILGISRNTLRKRIQETSGAVSEN